LRAVPERRAFTIGHSTHALDAFTALLERHGVRRVADVRRFPGSRRHPQFGREALAPGLAARGIGYAHVGALGGRRSVLAGSPNAGWEEAAFQGYADHMASEEFAAALGRLEGLARTRPTAIMCAEAQWWRRHRRLLSDALLVTGFEVLHIDARGGTAPHELTEFATIEDGRIGYPPAQAELDV
jgi:uncharacterized protein (DUF488 family)